MTILVTGATGLVGSHLCKKLVSEGYPVVGLVRKRDNSFIEQLADNPNFTPCLGDIRDTFRVEQIFQNYDIDTVLHMAAHLPITPFNDIAGVNVKGTINLLKSAYRNNVKGIVFASSVSVYSAPPKYLPVDELHTTNAPTVYGLSKIAGEWICNMYSDKMRVASLRYAGIFGTNSERNRVVNLFIRCALNNQPIILDGDGTHSSEFVYIDDVIQGTYLAWQNKASGVFNIGSGEETTIKELAQHIVELTNSKSEVVCNGKGNDRPFRFYLDITKARNELGYSPLSLREGLEKYLAWFYRGDVSMVDYSQADTRMRIGNE